MIDAHVHMWTDDFARFPLAQGFSPDDMWLPRFTPLEYDACTGSTKARPVRLNLVQMTWYGLDHSYILSLIASDPARFSGTGCVPAVCDVSLAQPGDAMRALSAAGIQAFRVRGGVSGGGLSSPDGRWMDTPGHESMFEAAAAEQLALSFLGGPGDLEEIDRMMYKHPRAPVILDHFMGCVGRPDLASEADPHENLERLCEMGRRHLNCYAKLGPLDHFSTIQAPFLDMIPYVSKVIQAFGPERCMWESDCGGPGCPLVALSDMHYDMSDEYASSIELVSKHCSSWLSEDEIDMVLGGTAETLFFPPEREAR